jgi:hypothetical protein
MFRFTKIKISLLVFGLLVALGAILAGVGFVGGTSSASNPSTASVGVWRELPDAPDAIAAGRTTVWTGSEMIVTGFNPGPDGTFVDSTEVAQAYNPGTNGWRQLPAPPKTANYCRRSATWAGDEMLVWGCGLTAYSPTTNVWRRLPDAPTRHGIVAWTGRELIGWGGGCCGDVSEDGSAYNPLTNTWRKLASAPVRGQQSPVGAWTGRELVVFNGRTPEGTPVVALPTTRGRTRGGGFRPNGGSALSRSRSTTATRSTCWARAETPCSRSILRTIAGGSCRGRSSSAMVWSPPGRGTACSHRA